MVRGLDLDIPTYWAPITFGNTGNLGLPIALFAFGQAGFDFAVVIFAVMAILSFTFGVWVVAGGGNPVNAKHGAVSLQTAIAVSSDVYFYIQGLRMWKFFEKYEQDGSNGNPADLKKGYAIQNVAKRFGFDVQTGIGLPNEHVGRVPDESFKELAFANSTDPFARLWLPGDSIALAVGQGDLLVTPLQMAVAYAAFANGGDRYAPRLASSVLAPGGETILRDLPPQNVGTVKVSKEFREQIMGGLINALSPGGIGTAGRAFSGYGGVEVAGKTGTAEVYGKQDTSVFMAIVNPNPKTPDEGQYVIAVFVEQGGNGGSVAAPIARRIAEGLSDPSRPPASVRLVPPSTD
jgi:penicillin-binding protein 2